jgi:hypothetical protein
VARKISFFYSGLCTAIWARNRILEEIIVLIKDVAELKPLYLEII